jgi:RNA polymerase sigma-70 factor, ECF subfamily
MSVDSHAEDPGRPAPAAPAGERSLDDEGLDASFIDLYRAWYPKVVRALELSGSARPSAEDCAQEAFARTLVHWRRVRRGANPPGYVFTTAFRLARRRTSEIPSLDLDGGVGVDLAEGATLRVSAAPVLAAMPSAVRRAAVLCLVVGLTPREAALALGSAPATIRKQLASARELLAAALGEGQVASG